MHKDKIYMFYTFFTAKHLLPLCMLSTACMHSTAKQNLHG